MTDRTFIELSQRGISSVIQISSARHPDLFCAHCARPRSTDAPVELIVDDERLMHSPLSGDPYHGVAIAKKSLLGLIKIDDISKYLCVGAVRSLSGKLFDDWVYLYSPDRIIIRGTREARFRSCPECGHTLYSSQGPEYLYPAPPYDIPIFQSDKSSLLVDSRYLDRARLPKSRWLGSQILEVVNEPRDGHEDFPYPYG